MGRGQKMRTVKISNIEELNTILNWHGNTVLYNINGTGYTVSELRKMIKNGLWNAEKELEDNGCIEYFFK